MNTTHLKRAYIIDMILQSVCEQINSNPNVIVIIKLGLQMLRYQHTDQGLFE